VAAEPEEAEAAEGADADDGVEVEDDEAEDGGAAEGLGEDEDEGAVACAKAIPAVKKTLAAAKINFFIAIPSKVRAICPIGKRRHPQHR
jgi:hypothetical protein